MNVWRPLVLLFRNIVTSVRKDFALLRDPYQVPKDMIEDKLNHLGIWYQLVKTSALQAYAVECLSKAGVFVSSNG